MRTGWQTTGGRTWRYCDCRDWDAEPGTAVAKARWHYREKVPATPVEICYHADEAAQVITVLRIRTMDDDDRGGGSSR